MTRFTVVVISFIVIILMFYGLSYAKIDLATCVGMWLFDEGKGDVAKDSSGNQNDGTLKNGPKWVTGKSGTALEFDGIDDYVEIPDSASLRVQSFTLSAWINLNVRPYQAGHKHISSTERYKTTNTDELHKQLELFHPLR